MKSLLTVIAIALYLPAFCQYNFYFGNLHCHSAYSDGNKDSATSGTNNPGNSYSYAKGSYHMDFLGIADHNHYSSLNNPGMHVADYAKGLFQADTANREGSFVCMYGMEWGAIDNGGHVVTYGIPGLIGWESGSGLWGPTNNYDIFCGKTDYTSLWKIINSYPNAFSTLAHPQTNDFNSLVESAYDIVADSAVTGTAIRNGAAFSTTNDYTDPVPTSYVSVYLKALAKGFHVGPVCDQDNHYTNFGRTNRIRTVVLAKNLKRDSITAAYKAMRFYGTDDWNAQVDFTINGNFMGSDITAATNSAIQVTITDPDITDTTSKIEIFYGVPGSGTNATVLQSATLTNTLNFNHVTSLNDKFYYFIKITQKDGDLIYTAPIWVYRNLSNVPLTLLNFTAVELDNKVSLDWLLAPTLGNGNIEIERSTDGIHFSVIGNITANSNIADTHYTFIDALPENGTNFYRIKQIELSGSFTYSAIAAVTINRPAVQIVTINPNPVMNTINVFCHAEKEQDIICKIYSAEGREVKNIAAHFTEGDNAINADVSNLTKGIYFIVISKTDSRITEGKFVKL